MRFDSSTRMSSSFSNRLNAAIFLLALFSLMQGSLTWWVATQSSYHLEKSQIANKLLTEFIDLAGNKQRLKVWLAQYLLTNDSPASVKIDLNNKMATSLRIIREHLERDVELSQGSVSEMKTILQQKERLRTLEINIESLRTELEKVKRAEIGDDTGTIWKTLINIFDNLQGSDLRGLIADAIQVQKIRAAAAEAAARESLESIYVLISILSTLILLTGVLLAVRMSQSLRSPLGALVQAAIAMKQGKLEHRIEVIEPNEFGVVAKHFNEMATEIERNRLEEIETKKQIEAQVKERTAELQSALDRLRAKEVDEKLFLMSISHEMRTPTTAILGEAEVTLRDEKASSEVYRSTLENIVSICRQLSLRIEDLLVLTQSDHGNLKLAIRPQPIGRLKQAIREAGLVADPREQRNLVVKDETTTREHFLRVAYDQRRVTQMLVILLENAVRYSPPGSSVEILLAESSELLTITLRNPALELAELDLEQITQKYYRSPNARKLRPEGLGIGLTIARTIARAHQTELMFSRSGDHFVASFSLPIQEINDADIDH